MRKITLVLLALVTIMLSACSGAEKSLDTEITENAPSVQTIAPVTENTKMPESVSKTDEGETETESEGNKTADKDKGKTKKTTTAKKTKKTKEAAYKPIATTDLLYEMRISYGSLSDFKSKVSGYNSFADLLKAVDIDKNNDCANPFKQEGLVMLFEDKKAFSPIFPKGYKFKRASLCSRNFFDFTFTDDKGDEQKLIIYTNANEAGNDKIKRAFESEQGTIIYKNSSKQYCWFLDDKYLVVYNGDDKDFIDDLYFEAVYIH